MWSELGLVFRRLCHLWYFPAAMTGCAIVLLWGKRSPALALAAAAGAYAVGLLGDSYYGLAERVPLLRKLYGVLFTVSSRTRNGVLYAPIFLSLGMVLGLRETGRPVRRCAAGLAVTAAGLLAEGAVVYRLGLQRHSSMYLLLPAVMLFLFRLLLSAPCKAPKWSRAASLWLYILHPWAIVLWRVAVRAAGLPRSLAENSLLILIFNKKKTRIFGQDRVRRGGFRRA